MASFYGMVIHAGNIVTSTLQRHAQRCTATGRRGSERNMSRRQVMPQLCTVLLHRVCHECTSNSFMFNCMPVGTPPLRVGDCELGSSQQRMAEFNRLMRVQRNPVVVPIYIVCTSNGDAAITPNQDGHRACMAENILHAGRERRNIAVRAPAAYALPQATITAGGEEAMMRVCSRGKRGLALAWLGFSGDNKPRNSQATEQRANCNTLNVVTVKALVSAK